VLKRVAGLLVAFPVAVLLIALAVSNRHSVRLILDPFRPDTPALSLEMPFYVYLLGTLVVGVLLGGFATWLTQSHWRRSARTRAQDAMRWRAEADRLARERDRTVAGDATSLAVARR
jgi:uncharacterized integral membrane protein